jgi:hypothetical protein
LHTLVSSLCGKIVSFQCTFQAILSVKLFFAKCKLFHNENVSLLKNLLLCEHAKWTFLQIIGDLSKVLYGREKELQNVTKSLLFCFRINLPGRYYELNVHFGVFVGGMGNFNEIFLGNQENFRGCLDSVFFNGVDVMSQAKVRKSTTKKRKTRQDLLQRLNMSFFSCLFCRNMEQWKV